MFLQETAAYAVHLIDCFDHVDRHADRSCLVGNGARNRLADPPCRICTEFIALGVVELVDGLQKADISFLNEIQERHAASRVLLGNGYDQTEVGVCHFLLGFQSCFLLFRGRIFLLAFFDRLRQFHFLFCGKKRIGAAFTQVQAYRITYAAGCRIVISIRCIFHVPGFFFFLCIVITVKKHIVR